MFCYFSINSCVTVNKAATTQSPKYFHHVSPKTTTPVIRLFYQAPLKICWEVFFLPSWFCQHRKNWDAHKRLLMLLRKSTCSNALAKTLLHHQQLDSTCWPGARSVPDKTCALAFLWLRSLTTIALKKNKTKKKEIPSVQQWDLLGMQYTDARSVTCASKAKHEWSGSCRLPPPTFEEIDKTDATLS